LSDTSLYGQIDERSLFLLVAKGDAKAYQVIYDRYADRMYANALHFSKSPELAEELTQEIFIRLWLKREKLAAVDHFDAYLFTLARNLIRTALKKKVFTTENATFLAAYFEDAALTPEAKLEFRELESRVQAAIQALPTQMQTVFRLSRIEGLTHEQIAQTMNISVTSSKTYMVRALLAIRKSLGADAARLGLLLWLLHR
jgi:RNA polymerase sigma-70 factor (ECF subfamily)